MTEYRGHADDPRYDGWSYLGDKYRCPLADGELSCHHRKRRLLVERRETDLRHMVDEGHRCAFVRLMELLVEAGRVGDLREIALGGDERAGVTLAEYGARGVTRRSRAGRQPFCHALGCGWPACWGIATGSVRRWRS